jgi:hypothetical protein
MLRRRYRVRELDIPMHSTAKRFVLRVAAPAQAEVFARRTFGPRNLVAEFVNEMDAPRYPVWAVF